MTLAWLFGAIPANAVRIFAIAFVYSSAHFLSSMDYSFYSLRRFDCAKTAHAPVCAARHWCELYSLPNRGGHLPPLRWSARTFRILDRLASGAKNGRVEEGGPLARKERP